jgi:uncharacterized protein (DUF3820 family)
MTYRCEVPDCGAKVRVVCDRGHAYAPHEDGAQVLVPGTEPIAPVDSAAVVAAAEAARARVPVTRSYSTTANALKMPFGKHRGESIEDLPSDYIEWALRELDSLRPAIKEEMEAQLTIRGGHGVNRGRQR